MSQPEKVFRIGYVSASVFANEIDTGNGKRTVRNVVLQRRYRDGDETKYTGSFGLAEIPQAQRVLDLARQYIESHEVEVNLGD